MRLFWPSSRRGLACSHKGNQRNNSRNICSSVGSGLRLACLTCYCQSKSPAQPRFKDCNVTLRKTWLPGQEKSGPFWQSIYHSPQWQKSPPKDIGMKPNKNMYSTLPCPFHSNTEEARLHEVFGGEGPFYSDLATPFLCFLRPTTSSLRLSFFISKMVNLPSW